MNLKKLSPQEERVILHKGTEAPFSGEFYENKREGKYHCKQCAAELFSSEDKFESHCGWPSFDDEVPNSVEKITDADGRRIEILCKKCLKNKEVTFMMKRKKLIIKILIMINLTPLLIMK
jgi:peptide methionine sulfoxide reductase MsrB